MKLNDLASKLEQLFIELHEVSARDVWSKAIATPPPDRPVEIAIGKILTDMSLATTVSKAAAASTGLLKRKFILWKRFITEIMMSHDADLIQLQAEGQQQQADGAVFSTLAPRSYHAQRDNQLRLAAAESITTGLLMDRNTLQHQVEATRHWYRALDSAAQRIASMGFLEWSLDRLDLDHGQLRRLIQAAELQSRRDYQRLFGEFVASSVRGTTSPHELQSAMISARNFLNQSCGAFPILKVLKRIIGDLGFSDTSISLLNRTVGASDDFPVIGVTIRPPLDRRLAVPSHGDRDLLRISLFEVGRLLHDACLDRLSFIFAVQSRVVRGAFGVALDLLADDRFWNGRYVCNDDKIFAALAQIQCFHLYTLRNLMGTCLFRLEYWQDPHRDPDALFRRIMETFTGFSDYPEGYAVACAGCGEFTFDLLGFMCSELTGRILHHHLKQQYHSDRLADSAMILRTDWAERSALAGWNDIAQEHFLI